MTSAMSRPTSDRVRASRTRSPLIYTLARSPSATWRFFTRKNGAWGPRIFALLALVYVFVPIDLVADVIPFFGWLDDIGVMAMAMGWIAKAVHKELHREGDERPLTSDESRIQAASTADLTSS